MKTIKLMATDERLSYQLASPPFNVVIVKETERAWYSEKGIEYPKFAWKIATKNALARVRASVKNAHRS